MNPLVRLLFGAAAVAALGTLARMGVAYRRARRRHQTPAIEPPEVFSPPPSPGPARDAPNAVSPPRTQMRPPDDHWE